jgi:hypothetical protein
VSATCLVLQFLCSFAAVDRVDIKGLLPNPGGDAKALVAEGRYWVAPGHKLVNIMLIAELRGPAQWSSISANRGDTGWNGKLLLPAGAYDCRVEMTTRDNAGRNHLTRSPSLETRVK